MEHSKEIEKKVQNLANWYFLNGKDSSSRRCTGVQYRHTAIWTGVKWSVRSPSLFFLPTLLPSYFTGYKDMEKRERMSLARRNDRNPDRR